MRCERLRQAFGAAPSEENGSEAEPSFAPGTLYQSSRRPPSCPSLPGILFQTTWSSAQHHQESFRSPDSATALSAACGPGPQSPPAENGDSQDHSARETTSSGGSAVGSATTPRRSR